MSKVLMELSVSLDGFVAGPDVSLDAPLGRGGELLHEWMFAGKSSAESRSFEIESREPEGPQDSNRESNHHPAQIAGTATRRLCIRR